MKINHAVKTVKIVASVGSETEAVHASSLDCVDVIELRLDLFNNLPSLEFIKNMNKEVIITVRKPSDGGKFHGGEEERYMIYEKYARACHYADVETRSNDSFFELLSELPVTIIESYHNFKETPSYRFLANLIESSKGDIFKIAVMGRRKKDFATVVRILSEFENIVAFLMGREFSYSRIVAAVMGSPFIYCHAGTSVAPGQIHVEDADKILRILGIR
jgi:3-dehydroquinate dehydratase-1